MMTTRGFVSATRSVATWRRSRATDVTTTSEQASLIYLAPSASDHVDDGEDDDPDRVHEMPVPGHELHALDVRGLERPRPGEHADEREHHDPDDHVRGVQADQRVKRRPEQIRPDRDAFARDEPQPLGPVPVRNTTASTTVASSQAPQRRTAPRPNARTASATVTLLESRHTVPRTGTDSTSFGDGPLRLFPRS